MHSNKLKKKVMSQPCHKSVNIWKFLGTQAALTSKLHLRPIVAKWPCVVLLIIATIIINVTTLVQLKVKFLDKMATLNCTAGMQRILPFSLILN